MTFGLAHCEVRRKINPEKETTTYPTNEATLNESRLAVKRPKNIKKKVVNKSLTCTRGRSTSGKMEESHVSGVLYDRRGLWYYVTHDVPQGGYSSFFL